MQTRLVECLDRWQQPLVLHIHDLLIFTSLDMIVVIWTELCNSAWLLLLKQKIKVLTIQKNLFYLKWMSVRIVDLRIQLKLFIDWMLNTIFAYSFVYDFNWFLKTSNPSIAPLRDWWRIENRDIEVLFQCICFIVSNWCIYPKAFSCILVEPNVSFVMFCGGEIVMKFLCCIMMRVYFFKSLKL